MYTIAPGAYGIETVPVTIPPLNTNIAFKGSLPVFTMRPDTYRLTAPEHLPESWDWRNSYPGDTSEVQSKKLILTQPPNQARCGSCWAVSSASVISDVFVVQKGFNPNLSATYAMATYPQGKCTGGYPPELLKSVSESGIATNNCIDYSWCLANDTCSGQGQAHFTTPSEEELSEMVPNSGCYSPNNESKAHMLYFIKDPTVIYLDQEPDIVNIIKSHIYNYGPVIGGFHVFDNFISGDFTKSGGVYIEYIDYKGPNYFLSEEANWMGSHAISIIGWGIQKGVRVLDDNNNETVKDVPYWYCRNSWAPVWGSDGGFFKIAMYPINKKSQFEKLVAIETPSGTAQTGGIITLMAGDVTDGTFDKTSTEKELNDPKYYEKDQIQRAHSDVTVDKSKRFGKMVLWTLLAILLIFISVYVYMRYFRNM